MKKIILYVIGTAIIAMAVVNLNLALNSGKFANWTLANTVSLAQQESCQNNCYRIVSTCNCKLKNGMFHSVRITECEHYYNPVCGSTCSVTSCPSGTSC